MAYALFLGCAVSSRALKYEISARNLCKFLGLDLIDLSEFGCCGFPAKAIDSDAALTMAARNLALAEEKGIDIVGLCTGCVAVLCEAMRELEVQEVREKVNRLLQQLGGPIYRGTIKVKHLARFLKEEYGMARLRRCLTVPQKHLSLAVHHGCHFARPAHAHGYFENHSHPSALNELLECAGATTVEYATEGLCCGLTILATAETESMRLVAEKLENLMEKKIDALVIACPSCGIAYENNQKLIGKKMAKNFNVPVLYFTQIL